MLPLTLIGSDPQSNGTNKDPGYKVVSYLCVLSKGEGVAYRGRLLVELESKLGEEIDKELETMAPAELVRVQVSYLLFVSL